MSKDLKDWMVPWLYSSREYYVGILDKAMENPGNARLMLNENPIPPSEKVILAVADSLRHGNWYPDSFLRLRTKIGQMYDLGPNNVALCNGSSDKGLYGHPERNDERGIFFSSGRLGHLWSYVNGIAQRLRCSTLLLSSVSRSNGTDAVNLTWLSSKICKFFLLKKAESIRDSKMVPLSLYGNIIIID